MASGNKVKDPKPQFPDGHPSSGRNADGKAHTKK